MRCAQQTFLEPDLSAAQLRDQFQRFFNAMYVRPKVCQKFESLRFTLHPNNKPNIPPPNPGNLRHFQMATLVSAAEPIPCVHAIQSQTWHTIGGHSGTRTSLTVDCTRFRCWNRAIH